MEYDFDLVETLLELDSGFPDPVDSDSPQHGRDRDAKKSNHVSPSRSRSRSSRGNRHHSRKDGSPRRRGQEQERQSRVDKSQREDCSIMVMGVHPSAGDRDVYEFFSKEAGKVRDVSVIRDSRTGKSKGVAYVEFYLQESVVKALGCNGRTIRGFPIRVQASGAEKNRAAEAQKAVHVQMQERPIMLYLMGLIGRLEAMDESDLRLLFSPFGDIDLCEIGRCPYTGRSRGYAHLQFSRAADAREAMACLNEFSLGGQIIQVGYLASSLDERDGVDSLEPEYLKTNHQRNHVMQALER